MLFRTKTDVGDAFIIYGILEKILDVDDLSEEERYRYEKHVRTRKNSKLRGAHLHGLKLDQDQLNSILKATEG